jgi:hypothetical protein
MAGKRKAAKVGTKAGTRLGARFGARVAPKAGKLAGKTTWRAGKTQARLTKQALSSKEPVGARVFKYGLLALAGFAIGALVARSRSDNGGSPSSTDTEYQHPEDPNRTGAERGYSDPSSGPLIGEQHRGQIGDVPVQHEEVENRIRARIGEDPRTRDIPRVNVEVNDGVAELRGVAPTEDAKQAAGEVAASTEGVREVRNLLTVS